MTAQQAILYGMAGSSLLQGVAGLQAGEANANAMTAAARQSLAAGAANKTLSGMRSRAQLGEMKAQMGAQGSTFSGSPMLVYLDSVKNAALEDENAYYQGQLKASGLSAQSKIARMGGYNSLLEGAIRAGGSFLLGKTL
jgi:hypothetical protein